MTFQRRLEEAAYRAGAGETFRSSCTEILKPDELSRQFGDVEPAFSGKYGLCRLKPGASGSIVCLSLKEGMEGFRRHDPGL
ncbi:MAG: hypothetical protein ACLTBV_23165 [Enterocloster bolteae]